MIMNILNVNRLGGHFAGKFFRALTLAASLLRTIDHPFEVRNSGGQRERRKRRDKLFETIHRN